MIETLGKKSIGFSCWKLFTINYFNAMKYSYINCKSISIIIFPFNIFTDFSHTFNVFP